MICRLGTFSLFWQYVWTWQNFFFYIYGIFLFPPTWLIYGNTWYFFVCRIILLLLRQIIVAPTHPSGLCYTFTTNDRQHLLHTLKYLIDITKALHFTLQHKNTQTGNISKTFLYVFLRTKTKQKRSFLISFTVYLKVSKIYSLWQTIFTQKIKSQIAVK